jgi:hypothetical protein
MLWRRKIMTWMLLFRKGLDLIMIMIKFNLHNFDYLLFVFAQAMTINIPLLVIEIGHLQSRRQFLSLQVMNSSPTHH